MLNSTSSIQAKIADDQKVVDHLGSVYSLHIVVHIAGHAWLR